MSYQYRNTKPPASPIRQAMGDVASTIVNAIGTAANVASDPYLSETICHVQQLAENEASGKITKVCAPTAPGLRGGIGLRKTIPAQRGYIYAESHPWVYPAAIGVVVGVPFLLGYLFGKD